MKVKSILRLDGYINNIISGAKSNSFARQIYKPYMHYAFIMNGTFVSNAVLDAFFFSKNSFIEVIALHIITSQPQKCSIRGFCYLKSQLPKKVKKRAESNNNSVIGNCSPQNTLTFPRNFLNNSYIKPVYINKYTNTYFLPNEIEKYVKIVSFQVKSRKKRCEINMND